MPARTKPAVTASATPRSIRASKENASARLTIRNATVGKSKAPRPPAPARATPTRILSQIVPPVVESPSTASGNDENPPHGRDNLMEGIETVVRNTISEMFAARDAEGERHFATTDAARVSSVSPPVATPQHILSRWPWVGQDTIDLISNGKFEIDNLPRLHRSDELRNAYLKRSIKGIYQPLEGGPAEIVIGTTKLQSSFKDPTTFFLAWHIYVSIRAEFKPSQASGLANWTERILYFVQLNYPWPSILEYIITYYQKIPK